FPAVHLSVCPHAGPTSKADNLNWIFQSMLRFESDRQAHFDVVVTHDAEDLIHPEELGWVNYHTQKYDMVQIPVLPLPTPAGELDNGDRAAIVGAERVAGNGRPALLVLARS